MGLVVARRAARRSSRPRVDETIELDPADRARGAHGAEARPQPPPAADRLPDVRRVAGVRRGAEGFAAFVEKRPPRWVKPHLTRWLSARSPDLTNERLFVTSPRRVPYSGRAEEAPRDGRRPRRRGAPDARGDPRHGRAAVRGARCRRRRGARPGARDGPHGVEPLQPLPEQAGALRRGARARPRGRSSSCVAEQLAAEALRPEQVRATLDRLTAHLARASAPRAAAAARAARGDRRRVQALIGRWLAPLYREGIAVIAEAGRATPAGTPTRCRTWRSRSSAWSSPTSPTPRALAALRRLAAIRSRRARWRCSAGSSRRRSIRLLGPRRAEPERTNSRRRTSRWLSTEQGKITDEGIAKLRARIGKGFAGRRPWRTEVTRDAIYHLALAIGDLNPLYLDEDYAKKTRWGTLLAPPIIVQSMDTLRAVGHSGLPEGLPGVHSIWTGLDATSGSGRCSSAIASAPSRYLKEVARRRAASAAAAPSTRPTRRCTTTRTTRRSACATTPGSASSAHKTAEKKKYGEIELAKWTPDDIAALHGGVPGTERAPSSATGTT